MKKIIILLLSLLITAMTICGCGTNSPDSGIDDNGSDSVTGTVEVYYWKSGVKITFLEELKKAFEAKNENIKINLDSASADANVFFNTIDQGASINTIDLYIGTMGAFWNRTEYLEPLDEILNTTIAGESKTIGEKIKTVSYKSDDRKTYALPWQESVTGMVYNEKMFNENNWTVPKTTDELITLSKTIIDAKLKSGTDSVTPFIHFANGYWKYLIEPWWAQYDGIETYNNFWAAKSVSADGTFEQPSNQVWKQAGRLEALKVLEKLISPENSVYPGSNGYRNTEAQPIFVNGKAAMMPNGAWLESESKKDLADYKIMKTPVISSVGTKLGIDDATLSNIVKYIDGEIKEAPKNVNPETIEKVKAIRNITFTEAGNFHVTMPKYSDVKGATKEFLKFMYSDEGIKIMAKYTQLQPVARLSTGEELDVTNWSDFAKNSYKLQKDATFIYKRMNYALFYKTDIEEAWATNPASIFSNSNPASRQSAEELFNTLYNNMTGSRWQKYLMQAGLD